MAHKYVVGRQAVVLAYIMKNGKATGQELMDNLDAGKNVVYSWLHYLTKKGLLRREPAGRVSVWKSAGDAWRKAATYRAHIEDINDPKLQDMTWLGLALETVKKRGDNL